LIPTCKIIDRHCERSEAIQSPCRGVWIASSASPPRNDESMILQVGIIGRVEEASGSRFAADSPLDAGAAAATPSSPTCGADDILKVADASGEPVNAGDSANLRLIVLIRWVNCPNFLAYFEPRDSVIFPSSRGRAAGAAALAGAESSVHAAVSSIPPPARRGNSSRDTTPFLSLSINCKLQKRGRP
jgi:hypothetical protein